MAAYRRVYGVTCRLTDKKRDQLRNPTLGNRVYELPLPTFYLHVYALYAKIFIS